jgi:hypothetical protein
MNYTPMTDEEIATANLIPDGTECAFEVAAASAHTSKARKESIKLALSVYYGDMTRRIDVYLTPNYPKLFKHAIVSMLSQAEYEAGNISAEVFEDKTGRVIVGVEDNVYNGEKTKKNVVRDFLKSTNATTAKDNDLPF